MGKLLKFAGNKINRLEVERREEEWIKQKFKDPKSKVIIYFKSKILIRNSNNKISIKFIELDQLKKISEKLEYYLIGSLDGETYLTSDLSKLGELSEKYGFNLNFEGGEAETFVVDCPLYSHPIQITKSKKIWDGYRGTLEINDIG